MDKNKYVNRSVLIGVTLDHFDGFTPSMLLGGLKILGIEFVEISHTIFSEVDNFSEKLGNIKTGFHLPIVHETGWDISCTEHENEINDLIKKLNQYKEKLHIQHIICHPPEKNNVDISIKTSKEFLLNNLKRLNIPVYLENTPHYNPEKFTQFYLEAKRKLGSRISGICYDAPHFFISGYDPVEQYQKMVKEIGCVHLSDCKKDKDVHLPFNGGILPLHNILKKIRNSKFKGYVTLEILPHSLKDIDAYINSYLKTLYFLNFKKYIFTKLRLFFLRPLIKKIIN